MKKIFYLFLLIFGIQSGITAQDQWSFGPKIGVGISNSSLSGLSINHSYYTGITVGAFGEYRNKNFAVECDLLYANQGLKWNNEPFKDHYLLIPLKVKLYIPHLLKSRLYVFAGPQLDLCVKRDENRAAFWTVSGGSHTYKSPYRQTSASISAGLGYRFDFGLDLAFCYNAGIVSNVKEYSDKNHVFQLTVGYDLYKLFK